VDVDSALALARELDAEDERLAAAIAQVAELDAEIAALGERASKIDRFLADLPAARERAAEALQEAEEERDRRRERYEEAERDLAGAERDGKEERIAAARRAVVRAHDLLSSAERRVERTREAAEDLEQRAARGATEAEEILPRTHDLVAGLRQVPGISPQIVSVDPKDLPAVARFASAAHAALFVARGSLETQRERVVREANELAASTFGEAVGATSVSLVRRRLERQTGYASSASRRDAT
jgi:chromosome segregation ATPase